jgi:hypothetical protein
LHGRNILARGEVLVNEADFTAPLFIGVPVPSKESEWACICVLGVLILSLSSNFSVGFWSCSDSVVFFVYHFLPSNSSLKLRDIVFLCFHKLCASELLNVRCLFV